MDIFLNIFSIYFTEHISEVFMNGAASIDRNIKSLT